MESLKGSTSWNWLDEIPHIAPSWMCLSSVCRKIHISKISRTMWAVLKKKKKKPVHKPEHITKWCQKKKKKIKLLEILGFLFQKQNSLVLLGIINSFSIRILRLSFKGLEFSRYFYVITSSSTRLSSAHLMKTLGYHIQLYYNQCD